MRSRKAIALTSLFWELKYRWKMFAPIIRGASLTRADGLGALQNRYDGVAPLHPSYAPNNFAQCEKRLTRWKTSPRKASANKRLGARS